jgi:flagellar motor switch protein FliM
MADESTSALEKEAAALAAAAADEAVGVRPFVFDRMHRVMRRRMPTLELIHERFARTVRLTLFNLVRRSVEVTIHLPQVKAYGEFLDELPKQTNINIVNVKPLRGVGCWIIDPQVVYLVIDNMFGGEGRLPPKATTKEYTATELRIIRRLLDGVFNEYEKAWKPVYEVKFEFMRSETSFQFAKITGPEEMVLHCKFTLNINGREGDIDLCIPFWVLEPVKTLLFNNLQSFQTEDDGEWGRKLEEEVQTAPLTMTARLAERQMTLGDILSLSVGEVIPIEITDLTTIYIDNLPMIRGHFGIKNGKYAVKAEEMKNPVEFLKTPFDSKLMATEGGVLTSFADKGGGSKPGSLESSFSAADLGGFSDFGPSGR